MEFKTPIKVTSHKEKVIIPASPCMKKIGYGTGIAVYELQRSPVQSKLRSPWAVKQLIKTCKESNTEINKRLKEEASILRKLNHPNIVGFRAFIEQDGKNVLAMEECSKSLGDAIEARFDETSEPFPHKIITKVASDIAEALNYLHNDALLLHCDVKSYNILIKGDYESFKLCDFGVSLPLDSKGNLDETRLMGDEEVEYMGTRVWCPPEILDCYPPIITTKADIYSYGLVIWEMIALMPPITDVQDSQESSSLNSSSEDIKVIRKRPDLPPDVELGEEYNFVLELFFICTQEDMDQRPTARVLCDIISQQ